MFQQIADISRFRGRRFQKFFPSRGIKENIAHQEGTALRSADLFHSFFFTALDQIAYSRQTSGSLRDQFHLADCRDTGKRLTAKTQGTDTQQVLHAPDLAGGMAQKSRWYLILRDSFPVIRDADERDTALFNFHSNGVGTRVNGIFYQFFYDRSRPFDDLTRRNFINCFLFQQIYLPHIVHYLSLREIRSHITYSHEELATIAIT